MSTIGHQSLATGLSTNERTDLDAERRVVVGLSGGVDSAVGALLLRERGYDVQALFMKNWEEDDAAGYCAATEDLADAQRVCDRLKIPLRTVNLASEYWDRVFTHFLAEYQALRTPNPDILCNREIKFRAFLDFALELGADVIATGHYARIDDDGNDLRLLKGQDPSKDQSYFLHALGQGQLRRSLFPLGELTKDEVRRLARRAGLANHAKKDSTGICFIGERPFKAFLQRYLEPRPGPIETPEGESVGEHEGLWYFTLGQRQGLNIGGRASGSGEPWYVVAKVPKRDALIVAQGHDHPLLYSRQLSAIDLHWIRERPAIPMSCRAKTRYRQADQACCITALDGESCRVEFEQPQWAVTPGQSVVFYQGDECLGGGVIQATERESRARI